MQRKDRGTYDPTWLVELLGNMRWENEETREQMVEAAMLCRTIANQDGETVYFAKKEDWKYDHTKTLDSKDGALVIIDILKNGQIGALTTYRDIDFSVNSSVVWKEVENIMNAHIQKQKKYSP